jgi:tRNA nucleotidyltransferase (CCA-adding enzyme)
VPHREFGTASLFSRRLGRIDVATARRESYPSPAALPKVTPSGLAYDLRRRDFSINSMAVRLDGSEFGLLHDPHDGQKDLQKGVIRSLYDESFVDDPTRIFRAIRFQGRYGFKLDRATGRHIKRTVALIRQGTVPLKRIGDELLRLLRETDPRPAARELEKLGAWELIHPALSYSSKTQKLFTAAIKAAALPGLWQGRALERESLLLSCLLRTLTIKESEALLRQLRYPKSITGAVLVGLSKAPSVLKSLVSPKQIKRSELGWLLADLPMECLGYYLAVTTSQRARARLSLFLRELSGLGSRSNGKDLAKLGLEPGPIYDKILSDLRDRRLDGELNSKREELEYIKEKYL